jgi:hypothetical protein
VPERIPPGRKAGARAPALPVLGWEVDAARCVRWRGQAEASARVCCVEGGSATFF